MSDPAVLVVGGGVSGAIIARRVAAAGHRVLLLEAGDDALMRPEGVEDSRRRFASARRKVPSAPYARNPMAPSPSVLDIFRPAAHQHLVQRGPVPYASSYLRALGGTTHVWLGSCPRLTPSDLDLPAFHGVGAPWPMSAEELGAAYLPAELELGVAGDAAEQEAAGAIASPGHDYPCVPIPPSWLDVLVAEGLFDKTVRLDGEEYAVQVAGMPQARRSPPRSGDTDDELCTGAASCVPLCPIQAKYNATRTLRAAGPLVRIEPRAVAVALELDAARARVTGVRVRRYDHAGAETFEEEVVSAPIVVLACNAIENAVLLLASDAANTSGLVGRHLMDHPFLLCWGLLPVDAGAFRGPSSTSSIFDLRDGPFRRKRAGFLMNILNWGWDPAVDVPAATIAELLDREHLLGAALRQRAVDLLSRQVALGFLVEQLPDPDNRVTIEDAFRTRIGAYRPVVHYDIDDYTRAGMAAARAAAVQIFAHLGIEDHTRWDPAHPRTVAYAGAHYGFVGGGHAGGTHRMGRSATDSVVNAWQRSWDHDNLYVTGAGSMPTMGSSNPTITLAALACRTAEDIVRRLAEG